MTEQEREMLFSLAKTLEATRMELDSMRVVLSGAAATLSTAPDLLPAFASHLQANIDFDESISLGSQMSDKSLEERARWLRRLLPEHVQKMLRLP
jgi:hypothetical protein